MSAEMSKVKEKNWTKSQKQDFTQKILKKVLLFTGPCAKISYCQADVRQNETLQNERPNAKK